MRHPGLTLRGSGWVGLGRVLNISIFSNVLKSFYQMAGVRTFNLDS